MLDSKAISRFNASRWGQIAQSVEQRIENPRVGGSIPSLATIKANLLVTPTNILLRLVYNLNIFYFRIHSVLC